MEQLREVLCYYPDITFQKRIGQTMEAVFTYQRANYDDEVSKVLEEFVELLIEQQITYPIRLFQEKES